MCEVIQLLYSNAHGHGSCTSYSNLDGYTSYLICSYSDTCFSSFAFYVSNFTLQQYSQAHIT